MSDFIDRLEKNAKVFLEWCRQQKELPQEERDILEFRIDDKWYPVMDDFVPWHHDKYRLRKRFKKHTATVYWYRDAIGVVKHSLEQIDAPWFNRIGISTVEFTEPQE